MGKSEWKEVKLGDVCQTNLKTYSVKDNWEFINYLDTGNITKNKISEIQLYDSNLDKIPSRAKRIVEIGDIIYSTVRPNQHHYGIIKNKISNLLVSTGFTTITPNNNFADRRFIYYYLTQQRITDKLQTLAEQSTSTYPSIRPIDIEQIKINLPPLTIQQKIASILSALDDKIELNQKINDNLEEQAQALFRSWFVDFEPFQDGEFIDSELGRIPKGWKVSSIYEIIDVIYGAPYKSSLFNDKKIGLPLIRIRDLKTFNPQFFTEEILPNTEYIEYGDVVAGMDAEFMPYIWYGKKGVLNQRVCKFVSKYTYVNNFFILNIIKPELLFVQSYKVGTTVSHLGKSDIDRFKVILPPQDILTKYSEITNALLNSKIKNSKEIMELSLLRDTLLPKLMSGELSVEEIEN